MKYNTRLVRELRSVCPAALEEVDFLEADKQATKTGSSLRKLAIDMQLLLLQRLSQAGLIKDKKDE